jgi:uncharacterized protein YjbI with pentapeptide repeats
MPSGGAVADLPIERSAYGPDVWVVVDGERLTGASFADRKLVNFAPIGAHFTNCSFERLVVEDMSFGSGRSESVYVDCVFDGAKLRVYTAGYARFVNCSFRNVNIRSFEGYAVEMINCTFSGRLSSGFLNGTVPPYERPMAGRDRNTIVDNDFSGLRITDFYFLTGVDLTRQKLPQSPDYLYLPEGAAAVAAGYAALPTCPDEWRGYVEARIRHVERVTADGQRQVFLRKKEFTGKNPAAVGWLLDLWSHGYLAPPPG